MSVSGEGHARGHSVSGQGHLHGNSVSGHGHAQDQSVSGEGHTDGVVCGEGHTASSKNEAHLTPKGIVSQVMLVYINKKPYYVTTYIGDSVAHYGPKEHKQVAKAAKRALEEALPNDDTISAIDFDFKRREVVCTKNGKKAYVTHSGDPLHPRNTPLLPGDTAKTQRAYETMLNTLAKTPAYLTPVREKRRDLPRNEVKAHLADFDNLDNKERALKPKEIETLLDALTEKEIRAGRPCSYQMLRPADALPDRIFGNVVPTHEQVTIDHPSMVRRGGIEPVTEGRHFIAVPLDDKNYGAILLDFDNNTLRAYDPTGKHNGKLRHLANALRPKFEAEPTVTLDTVPVQRQTPENGYCLLHFFIAGRPQPLPDSPAQLRFLLEEEN